MNPAALLDYDITSLILSTLHDLILEYTAKEPFPKMSIDAKKGKRIEQKSMMKETDAILNKRIDKLLLAVKETNPDFYAAYVALRNPVKPAVSNTVLKIQVSNDATRIN